jgi:rRNA biogenesis protein RRP5
LTLKRSVVQGIRILKFTDIEVGMKLKANVSAIKPYGIFVRIKNSVNVGGLCHHSEILDRKPSDDDESSKSNTSAVAKSHKHQADKQQQQEHDESWKTLFEIGDFVKVIVLGIDKQKRRISFGLKPSYFTADDMSDDDEDQDDEDETAQESSDDESAATTTASQATTSKQDSDDDDDDEAEAEDSEQEDADEDEDDEDDEDEDDEAEPMDVAKSTWSAGFGFSDTKSKAPPVDGSSSESESSSDDESANKSHKRKRTSTSRKIDEQRKIDQREQQLADSSQEPETVNDFERLLVGSPNSSYLWIKYMAFLLSISEVEKARQVCERALKRINYRSEGELENVWKAYLNLENMFGSSDTLMGVVQRALARVSDPRSIYFHLLDIYQESGKITEAHEIAKRMLSKFKSSTRVWLKYAMFMLLQPDNEGAQPILQRALKSIPNNKRMLNAPHLSLSLSLSLSQACWQSPYID